MIRVRGTSDIVVSFLTQFGVENRRETTALEGERQALTPRCLHRMDICHHRPVAPT